jgi:hypothetical protein
MAKVKSEPVKEAKEDVGAKVPTLSDAEFERRTKLDVSDHHYINPSLEHYRG